MSYYKYIPLEGGRYLLKLRQSPIVQLNPSTLNCEVLGWGITFPSSEAENVSREMARKFAVLFSKADGDRLTKDEASIWLTILDQIDFTSYCIDRAEPHYMEGYLKNLQPECVVEWHDGQTEVLPRSMASSLSELQPGDSFGVYVRLGHNNKILSVERPVLIGTA